MGAIAALACGAPSAASFAPASPCAAPPTGQRLTSLRGSGDATTAAFTVCGAWSADLDYRCPAISEITTTVVGAGRREHGPFGDGLVGMNIVSFATGGTYHLEIQAPPACTWSVDIDAGRV